MVCLYSQEHMFVYFGILWYGNRKDSILKEELLWLFSKMKY